MEDGHGSSTAPVASGLLRRRGNIPCLCSAFAEAEGVPPALELVPTLVKQH